MRVGKPNLVAMLLEVGEENAAVLLARSALPDEIDLGTDVDALMAFGLSRHQLDEVNRLTVGAVQSEVARRRGDMEQTISLRWADLVDQWVT